ncbi:uncharacterized protein LOC130683081 [Manis pentadactyla]|uniref:uncharacterized protein LOC130683081 n=1 Tax=Manis pentadactyla TaxID=143292 RepID=UPI00255CB1B0|nr:uncharacterized protein LOC130683081 [Manis pentadactyla]
MVSVTSIDTDFSSPEPITSHIIKFKRPTALLDLLHWFLTHTQAGPRTRAHGRHAARSPPPHAARPQPRPAQAAGTRDSDRAGRDRGARQALCRVRARHKLLPRLPGASALREANTDGNEETRRRRGAREWGNARREATAAPPRAENWPAASRPPAQRRGCGGGGGGGEPSRGPAAAAGAAGGRETSACRNELFHADPNSYSKGLPFPQEEPWHHCTRPGGEDSSLLLCSSEPSGQVCGIGWEWQLQIFSARSSQCRLCLTNKLEFPAYR